MTNCLKCFLIDDDIDDQKIFAIITEEVDETVICSFANDGIDALKILSKGIYVPDIIFMDVNMPRMDGIDCLKRIKESSVFCEIPVYMYSTTADPATLEITRELGAKRFIVKPPNISDLVSVLAEVFNSEKLRLGKEQDAQHFH